MPPAAPRAAGDFLRTPELAAALTRLISDMRRDVPDERAFRAWMPGCGSGEDAYWLAILLLDQLARLGRHCAVQVFATDIDDEALDTARAGLYPDAIKSRINPASIARYFVRAGAGYKVGGALKELVAFGHHDILHAPPFSQLDLVACRALPPGLTAEGRRRVLHAFDMALARDGVLMLGEAGLAEAVPGLFEAAGAEHLFRRRHPVAEAPSNRMILQAQAPEGADLWRQLNETSRHLMRMIEQLREANELLRARTAEEGDPHTEMAAADEALEVSTRKLRSLNQELAVANDRLVVDRRREASADLAAMFSGSEVAGALFDADLKLEMFTARMAELFALSPSDRGRPLADILPKLADPDLIEDALASRSLETVVERVIQTPSGRHFLRSVKSCRDEAGDILHLMVMVIESVHAREEKTDSRHILGQQLELLIDALPDAAMAIDGGGRIRYANSHAEELFGYGPDELIGQPIELLVPPEARDAHPALRRSYADQPGERAMRRANIFGIAKDGARVPVDVSLSPVTTAEGHLNMAVIRDMRETVKAQEALQDARRAAVEANVAKSHFLSAANHDLRQPLQAISLLHGVLERQVVNPQARETLARLDDAVSRMTDVTNALIELDQLETGGAPVDRGDISVAPLLSQLAEEFEPVAAAKGLSLRCVRASARIRSDKRLLTRIISNLLSNAIKYTDQGKILLGCRWRGSDLRIEVWDTGAGIAAGNLDAIFEEFYRLSRSDGGRFSLGLDLYVAQRSAEQLDCRLDVMSRLNRGSMFAVIVPDARREAPATGAESAPSEPVILLIESDSAQRQALLSLLAVQGYHVFAARNGAEAVDKLRDRSFPRPSAIVSGGSQGGEAALLIRREVDAPIPTLLLNGDDADVPPGQTAGIELLVKPVKPAKLLAAVEIMIKRANPGWQGGETRPRPAPRPASDADSLPDIAVVDSNPAVSDAVRSMIAVEGYKVRTFASAEAFLADPGRGHFRCAILDIDLGGMSGLELQKVLKAEPRCPAIIFLTGKADVPLAVEAIRTGAADFLIKPVDGTHLRETLARVLAERSFTAQAPSARVEIETRLATLTRREREIMDKLLEGELNKNIAADLGISERTTEHHRQSLMRKMGVRSLAMLVRMVAATENSAG